MQNKRPQAAELVHESEPPDVCEVEGNPPAEQVGESAGASEECASCVVLRNEKRKLSNTVKSLREKLIEKRKELTKIEKKNLQRRTAKIIVEYAPDNRKLANGASPRVASNAKQCQLTIL